MPDYDWRCHVCDSTVPAGNEKCTNCSAPSNISGDDVAAYRNNLQAKNKAISQKPYSCLKCGCGEFDHGQFRASAGGASAIFEIDNKRFTHITCSNCGFTEFYMHKVGISESIIDYLIN